MHSCNFSNRIISVLFSSVFSIHKNKDIDLLGEIILYIPQWSLDVSIDIWYTQVIEFFCNKWKNNVLHCQKQQKDNFITKKMPRMPTRDTQFPVKSKLVWPYSLSDLRHQIENACSHLFLDSLHDISHFLLGLELAFINTTTGLLFKQHSFYVGQASHQILKSLEKDLKSGDCLFCSTPHNINQSLPTSDQHKSSQSPNYNVGGAQNLTRI